MDAPGVRLKKARGTKFVYQKKGERISEKGPKESKAMKCVCERERGGEAYCWERASREAGRHL